MTVYDREPGALVVADENLVAVVEAVDLAVRLSTGSTSDGQESVTAWIEPNDLAHGRTSIEDTPTANHHRDIDASPRLRQGIHSGDRDGAS
jgi:hypothetical protein